VRKEGDGETAPLQRSQIRTLARSGFRFSGGFTPSRSRVFGRFSFSSSLRCANRRHVIVTVRVQWIDLGNSLVCEFINEINVIRLSGNTRCRQVVLTLDLSKYIVIAKQTRRSSEKSARIESTIGINGDRKFETESDRRSVSDDFFRIIVFADYFGCYVDVTFE